MKALVYDSAKNFSVKEVEKPKIKDNQVLVQVKACGICKTDVHIHEGEFMSKFPLIPGHEFTGIVVERGKDAGSIEIGARVACDNTELCGHCYFCQKDQPLYCENFYSLGVNGPGGFAEYVAVNFDKVFPIPDSMDFDTASFAEPLACAVHGMDRIDLKCGDDVLLFGSGPTGMLLAQLIKYNGAANLIVAAPTKFKLDILESMGIQTIQIDRNDYSKHTNELTKLFPRGFDVVIDATGYAPMLEQCFNFAKRGAKVVVYGVYGENETISINPYQFFEKEYSLFGSFAQTHCFDRALKYLEKGIVKVDQMITHRFPLEKFEEALEMVINGRTHIKVNIVFD